KIPRRTSFQSWEWFNTSIPLARPRLPTPRLSLGRAVSRRKHLSRLPSLSSRKPNKYRQNPPLAANGPAEPRPALLSRSKRRKPAGEDSEIGRRGDESCGPV